MPDPVLSSAPLRCQSLDAIGVDGQAADLVQRATDPLTGQVDIPLLGRWVADASARDFEAAAQAHSAIEAHLTAADPAAATDFNQAVVDAASNSSVAPGGLWAGGQSWLRSGTQLLVDNPILTKSWESTRSAWTGGGGFTSGLRELLERHDIQIAPGINPVPPGSVGRNAGVSSAVANNTNGALARDAIADRFRAQGLATEIEQPRAGGARRVDVVVDVSASDPRMNRRIEIESKVGRAGLDAEIRGQVAMDAHALRSNRLLRGSGQVLEGVGKVARPVGVVLDVIEVGSAFRDDGYQVGARTGRAASGVAGGGLGAWGGAAGGAAIGTAIFPGVGTAIGGVVGGIGGAIAGTAIGQKVFDTVSGWF